MKLRSLLVGFIGMILFAACSNESELGNPVIPTTEEGEATLSVMISNPQTKAVDDMSFDADVANIFVLIFKGTGDDAPLEKKFVNETAVLEVKDIPVTSGNKKVVVLANVKDRLADLAEGENGTSYADVKKMTLDFSEAEVNGFLSMSSKTYDVTLRVGKKNYLGYTDKQVSETAEETLVTGSGVNTSVKLYRNVARVKLSDIKYEKNDRYPGFKLEVKEVFILHARKQSALIGDGSEWGTTHAGSAYLNGVSNEQYKAWVSKLAGSSTLPHLSDEALYEEWTKPKNGYLDVFNGGFVVAEQSTFPEGRGKPSFYVYENTDIDGIKPYTLLVVKGDFTYQKDGKTEKMENRYYTVAVGVSGVEKGYTLPADFTAKRGNAAQYKGVLRNLSYLISFAVAGPGSDNPLDQDQIANLSATVKVRNWNVVENNESVN